VSRKDEFCSRIDRLHGGLTAAMRARVQSLGRRVHIVSARPAIATYPARLAMTARHVAEIGHTLARAVRTITAARDRRLALLERQLATYDAGRRLAAIRGRLAAADTHLRNGAVRHQERRQARLRAIVAGLESLSPLAVLGRGYAVAWDAERSRIIRDPAAVGVGDTLHVRVERGEIDCEVKSTTALPGTRDI
jgi:exodeoxyribonuclease VII large subunit